MHKISHVNERYNVSSLHKTQYPLPVLCFAVQYKQKQSKEGSISFKFVIPKVGHLECQIFFQHFSCEPYGYFICFNLANHVIYNHEIVVKGLQHLNLAIKHYRILYR